MRSRSSVPLASFAAIASLIAATAAAAAHAPRLQPPAFAGRWILDSATTGAENATARRRDTSAPGTATTATATATASASGTAQGARSFLTIVNLDTVMVVERRLEDRATRRALAPAERLSFRVDGAERTVPWTAPSGDPASATVRLRRIPDSAAVVLYTTRRVSRDATRVRQVQLVERMELLAGGRLRLTRTEWDGRRERKRVYWYSRG
ncbi:MAG: hypothetical protein ACJ8AO_14000 [Gemmatimonadaceae bacterium]